MSTIDERVVELRFNNQQFEQGVRKSMNTLDKLKESLDMAKSEKSMKQLEETANRMSFDKLASNVDVIANRFSTLGIIGTTALQNITNSAIAAGKQLVNAFAFEPVKSGFQEYETQINAVQTILANTSSKGTTLDQVNEALDELNHYADKTIYNFTEMTRNIGTFTAAGVDLDTSVSAIKGIANLAAVSGSTSQQASTAMYQLSQALAAGTVKLMDWNSVVNAGMGGEVFQNALKDTARVHGIAIDEMIAKEGSFRETLSKGWLSAEILTETLAKFTGDLSEEQLRSIGYSEQQIESIMEMGKTANDAATKVKTFTQLIDTLKEAAQSGWTQTWELVVGDFEEAKEFLTFLSNLFGNLINKSSDARNNLLEGALSTRTVDLQSWASFANEGIAGNELFQESLKETAREHGIAVDEMINNGGSFSESLKENWLTLDILTETLEKFDEESLKSAGYTEEQISALSALAKQAEETGTPLNKLITDIQQKPTGRELIIESIRNSLESVARVMVVVKSAWREVFPATTSEQLYKLLEGVESFTKSLVMSSEEMSKLKVSLQGVFSILDIITSIVGGTLKTGMTALSTLLGGVNFDILDITAAAGNAAIAFHDWFEANDIVNNGLSMVSNTLQTALRWIKEFLAEIRNIPEVSANIEKLEASAAAAFTEISSFGSGAIQIIKEFISELRLLDSDCSFDDFKAVVKKFATDMINHFSNIKSNFGSLENVIKQFKTTADSALTGAGEKFDWLKDKISDFVAFVKSHLSNVSLGAILTIGLGAGLISTALTLNKAANAITNAVEKITSVFGSIQKYWKAKSFDTLAAGIQKIAISIGILAGSLALLSNMDQEKLKSSAVILGILATALTGLVAILGVLSQYKIIGGVSGIVNSTTMLAASASILILVAALKKLEDVDMEGIESRLEVLLVLMTSLGAVATAMGMAAPKASIGTSVSIVALAGSLVLMVKALEELENVNMEGIVDRLGVLLVLLGSLGLTGMAASGLSFGSAAAILAIVSALNILVSVFQKIGLLNLDTVKTNVEAFIAVFGVLGGLMVSTSLAGKNAGKVGISVLAMSGALLIITEVIKQLSEFDDPSGMDRALETITKLFGIFSIVTMSTKLAGSHALQAGAAILVMSGAIAILSGIIYVLSQLDPEGVERGTKAIVALEAGFALIIGMTHFAESAKGTLLIISGAMVVLGTLIAAMSMIPAENLQNATIAITAVTAVFAILVASTHLASNTTVSVVAIVGALAAISLMLMALSELDNTDSVLTIAESLSMVMLSLSACMAIISFIPVVGAATGVAGLAIVIAGLTAILAALGGLSKIDGFEWLIKSGASVLADIGYAIGDFVGSIVGGFTAGATSGLPGIAANISGFFENIQIDSSVVESVAKLTEAMLLVTASNVIDGITKFITGSSAYEKFGESLADFGRALKQYGNAVNGVNVEAINNSIEPARALAEVMDAIPNTGGAAAVLLGDNTWETFGVGLAEYGTALKNYGEAVKDLDAESISNSIEPTKALSEVASALPNSGGLAAKLLGDNTWEDFGAGLTKYGWALKRYGTAVEGLDTESISNSIEPTKALSEVADALPNTGGLAAKLLGDNTWEDFGAGLTDYGTALKDYGEAVAGLQTNAIAQSVRASSSLAEVATAISEITMLSSMSKFGRVLEDFGLSFANYAQYVSNMDFESLQNIITFIKDLTSTSESLNELGNTLSLIGMDSVAQFLASFEDVDEEAIRVVTELADTIANNMLLALQVYVNKFKETGAFLIDGLVDGINSNMSKVAAAAASVGATASDATRDAVDSHSPSKEYEDIGHDVDSGFVTGVEKDLSDVATAGRLIGETAIEATRDALDSHSPSKEYESAGDDSATGYNSGLKNGAKQILNTVSNLAQSGVNVVKEKASEFKDVAEFYIDEVANGAESESTSSSVKSATNNAGENLVTNVANGISNCKAGEQAAKASAESIASTFTNALSELDASKEISDMEYSLWEALYGETSSASTKASHSVSNMLNNINYQVEKVNLAKQKYEALVKELGATSDDARSAYKEYMQAQLDLQDAMTGGTTTSDLLVEQAEAEYNLWYAKYGEASSESRIAQAKAQLVAKQVAAQNITIENLDAEYQQLVTTLGESNYLTIQAYIDLLNAKTELYDLYGEINQKATEPGQIIDVSDFDNWVEEFMEEIRQITGEIEIPDDIGETMSEGLTSSVSTALSDAQTSALANAVQPVGSEMVSAINAYQTDFYTAGVNLVDGFANGIRDHKSAAIEAAIEMAKETLEGVEIELEIGSPSKAFDRIGMYSDEGLAGGFKKFAYLVENSAGDVAEDAFMSVSGILANLSSLIDEGLDSTPTIRPVLDLSSITNDANTIDDLFAQYSTLAMTTNRNSTLSQNLAALNAMAGIQNEYKDNGSRDIVNAISDLNDRMEQMNNMISRLKIVMDTGALVGQLEDPLDQRMAQRATKAARGR